MQLNLLLCDLVNTKPALWILWHLAQHVCCFGQLQRLQLVLAHFQRFADVRIQHARPHIQMRKRPQNLPDERVINSDPLLDNHILRRLHHLKFLYVQLGQLVNKVNHFFQRQWLRFVLEFTKDLEECFALHWLNLRWLGMHVGILETDHFDDFGQCGSWYVRRFVFNVLVQLFEYLLLFFLDVADLILLVLLTVFNCRILRVLQWLAFNVGVDLFCGFYNVFEFLFLTFNNLMDLMGRNDLQVGFQDIFNFFLLDLWESTKKLCC